MASRYPTIKVVDYCYHPVHVKDDDKDIIVPCGKCDGCLLHKANEWSMRCGMEIEDSVASIFGSLTYSNKYLPRLGRVDNCFLVPSMHDGVFDLVAERDSVWLSDHPWNIRFNGVRDVRREDGIVIPFNYSPVCVNNWDNVNFPIIAYGSKRDIQLWLKLIRQDLNLHGFYKDRNYRQKSLIRYFVICEYGPTTYRPHYHFLLFCDSQEVASYLLDGSLYKAWQMCLPDRFFPYCHLCDSGARGYVTQYLTCFSDLPKVYRENSEIKPFRLSSKSPAIGFIGQNKEKIYEDVERGVIRYSRPLKRLGFETLLCYPADYLTTLFPKCFGYSRLSDQRRFDIYSYLYRAVREFGYSYTLLSQRLPEIFKSADVLSMRACYRFCREYVDSPIYYYYLLDNYYYALDMQNLKSFYESQQNCDFRDNPYKIFEYYSNIEVLCCSDDLTVYQMRALYYALSPFGFVYTDLLGNLAFFEKVRKKLSDANRLYRDEVSDIRINMVKMSKFNELTGNSPTIV